MLIYKLARTFGLSFLALLTFDSSSLHAQTPFVQWVQQYGTVDNEFAITTSADSLGNVFLGGTKRVGSLINSLAMKYNSSGDFQWIQQSSVTSPMRRRTYGVSADGLGNAYFTGELQNQLQRTSFLQKNNSSGSLLWDQQLGSASSSTAINSASAVLNNGINGAYLAGTTNANSPSTNDAYLSKYDTNGVVQWTQQFGTSGNEGASGLASDNSGNVYVLGVTDANLAGSHGAKDTFIRKYDANGSAIWTSQLGSSANEYAFAISADAMGHIFFSGGTEGSWGATSKGLNDAFMGMLNADGSLSWIKQFGTTGSDSADSLATDGMGNVYVGVNTNILDGPTSASGTADSYVAKYDALGNLIWQLPIGSGAHEYLYSISTDGLGNLYAAGSTLGNYGGTNAGGYDLYLVKIAEVPEPGSVAMILCGLAGVVIYNMRRKKAI